MELSKSIKIIATIFICLLLSFFSYKLCYFIAEKYFFDKFFYQKSVKYGYWLPNQKLTFIDFGKRGEDIYHLVSNTKVSIDNKKYNIAIFGDSFVWGQGVTDSQRFTVLLEKKLNKIRPTKIYSFANGGDNLFDNYIKYQDSLKNYGKMDLYIFALYNNDLVFNSDQRFGTQQFLTKFIKNCKNNISSYDTIEMHNSNEIKDSYFANMLINSRIKSFNHDSLNYCSYRELLPLLPKDNTIYIDLGNMIENWYLQSAFSNILNSDLNIIKTPYLNICANHPQKCYISDKDHHPSFFIHKSYSNILFKEIISNPRWNFQNQ